MRVTELVDGGRTDTEIEDSFSGPKEGFESSDNTGVVLLCVDAYVNAIPMRILIDSGASECFISEELVEEKGLLLSKN